MLTEQKAIITRFALMFCVTILLTMIPNSSFAGKDKRERTIKLALLPIIDSLPFYVAESEGFFKEAGIEVKGIPVASALDRDQLMQAGAIDGMLNEMTITAVFNRDKVQVNIIGSCRSAGESHPLFRILAAPNSGITSPKDLSGVPIGVSKNTIIEYVTDRLLQEEGLKVDQIIKKSVPAIPERFQLLMQGQLKAATLPDPLAKSAIDAGAIPVLADSLQPHLSVSVLSFSTDSMNEKSSVIQLFLKAWYKAAKKLNANPEVYRSLLLAKIRVPKNVQKTYVIPPFEYNRVPNSSQWEDVMEWLVEKGLLKKPIPYAESVTQQFLF